VVCVFRLTAKRSRREHEAEYYDSSRDHDRDESSAKPTRRSRRPSIGEFSEAGAGAGAGAGARGRSGGSS